MRKETEDNNGSKSFLYIIVAIVILTVAAFGVYRYQKPKSEPTPFAVLPDSTKNLPMQSKKDSLPPEDSLSIPSTLPIDYDGDNGPWVAYRIIGHSDDLTARNLRFGDKVWVDDNQSDESHKAVLMGAARNQGSNSLIRLNADLLIEEYRFEKYKTNFSLAPFATLSSGVKKILLDDNYSDGNTYSLTQNEARAKSAVAFGDFDEDGLEDVAVIIDNNEKQISRLLILCINKVTQQPYIAFAENYADKMRVRSFKKNAKIYMNTSEFVPAPREGIIATAEDVVLAILYDMQAQKFKTYFQE
ncbi:hypothetical protein ACFSQ3_05720 [Sphingobacterium corticis]|uniref:Uncharacterized protein n=1 Tax=Sphingobacterium corticis TaxID=1812823 RepID=A0ABW5NHR5_9SPHI